MRRANSNVPLKAGLAVAAVIVGMTTAAWALVHLDYLPLRSPAVPSNMTHIGVPPRQTDESFDARSTVDDWSCRLGC